MISTNSNVMVNFSNETTSSIPNPHKQIPSIRWLKEKLPKQVFERLSSDSAESKSELAPGLASKSASKVKVVITGDQSGKSTIINRLLGCNIIPVSFRLGMIVIHFRHGEIDTFDTCAFRLQSGQRTIFSDNLSTVASLSNAMINCLGNSVITTDLSLEIDLWWDSQQEIEIIELNTSALALFEPEDMKSIIFVVVIPFPTLIHMSDLSYECESIKFLRSRHVPEALFLLAITQCDKTDHYMVPTCLKNYISVFIVNAKNDNDYMNLDLFETNFFSSSSLPCNSSCSVGIQSLKDEIALRVVPVLLKESEVWLNKLQRKRKKLGKRLQFLESCSAESLSKRMMKLVDRNVNWRAVMNSISGKFVSVCRRKLVAEISLDWEGSLDLGIFDFGNVAVTQSRSLINTSRRLIDEFGEITKKSMMSVFLASILNDTSDAALGSVPFIANQLESTLSFILDSVLCQPLSSQSAEYLGQAGMDPIRQPCRLRFNDEDHSPELCSDVNAIIGGLIQIWTSIVKDTLKYILSQDLWINILGEAELGSYVLTETENVTAEYGRLNSEIGAINSLVSEVDDDYVSCESWQDVQSVLHDFYVQTSGRQWKINRNWSLGLRFSRLHGIVSVNQDSYPVRVDLSRNGLIGELPECLCCLNTLTHLDLSENDLSGTVPKRWQSLAMSLIELGLDGNRQLDFASTPACLLPAVYHWRDVHGMIGDLMIDPATTEEESRLVLVSFLKSMKKSDWNRNTCWKADMILSDWRTVNGIGLCRVVVNNANCPIQLNFDHMYLGGPIPSMIGRLCYLEQLDLSNNELGGEIPSCICSMQNLIHLDLSCNRLGGPIPVSLGRLTHLQWLYLRSNHFESVPESLGHLRNLQFLWLNNNPCTAKEEGKEFIRNLFNDADLSRCSLIL